MYLCIFPERYLVPPLRARRAQVRGGAQEHRLCRHRGQHHPQLSGQGIICEVKKKFYICKM